MLRSIQERLLQNKSTQLIALDLMYRDVGYITIPRLVLVGDVSDYVNLIEYIDSFVRAGGSDEYRRALPLSSGIIEKRLCGLLFHCWGDLPVLGEKSSAFKASEVEDSDLLRVGVLSDSGRIFLAGEFLEQLGDLPWGYFAGSRESFCLLIDSIKRFIEGGLDDMALEHQCGANINRISYELEFCTNDSYLAQSLPDLFLG